MRNDDGMVFGPYDRAIDRSSSQPRVNLAPCALAKPGISPLSSPSSSLMPTTFNPLLAYRA